MLTETEKTVTKPALITEENASEYSAHMFITDASVISLKPGDWPLKLETNLGNGLNFVRQSAKIIEGELTWVTYFQAGGCIKLRVYNT